MNGKSHICTGWGTVLFGLALGLSLIPTPPVQAQCQYEVTIIQGPPCPPPAGSPATIGTGINELGHVVGYYSQCGGGTGNEPFLWTPESGLITLDPPLEVASAANEDINEALQIAGTMGGVISSFRAYLYDEVEFLDLGVLPGADWSGASALNSQTVVVGWSSNVTVGPLEAFRWEDGAMTALVLPMGPNTGAADINEGKNQIVGSMGSGGTDWHGFLWETAVVVDLGVVPGGFTSQASAINSQGEVVGWGQLQNPKGEGNITHAFLWDSGEMFSLGTLPGFLRSFALDINDAETIVGFCRGIEGNINAERAFLRQGGVMTDLNDLIHANQGLIIKRAEAVNNAGQITGRASGPGGVVAVLLTPVNFPVADLNGDCVVNPFDLALLLASWGPCDACPADLNADGVVDPVDLALLLGNWG